MPFVWRPEARGGKIYFEKSRESRINRRPSEPNEDENYSMEGLRYDDATTTRLGFGQRKGDKTSVKRTFSRSSDTSGPYKGSNLNLLAAFREVRGRGVRRRGPMIAPKAASVPIFA